MVSTSATSCVMLLLLLAIAPGLHARDVPAAETAADPAAASAIPAVSAASESEGALSLTTPSIALRKQVNKLLADPSFTVYVADGAVDSTLLEEAGYSSELIAYVQNAFKPGAASDEVQAQGRFTVPPAARKKIAQWLTALIPKIKSAISKLFVLTQKMKDAAVAQLSQWVEKVKSIMLGLSMCTAYDEFSADWIGCTLEAVGVPKSVAAVVKYAVSLLVEMNKPW